MNLDFSKLLEGRYEAESLPDSHMVGGRVPDFGYNAINELNPIYQPLIDERTELKPTWPDKKEFAVCLTHDVDAVSSNSMVASLRRAKTTYSHRNEISTGDTVQRFLSSGNSFIKGLSRTVTGSDDPCHCYDKWLEIERKYDAKSTFFFLPDGVSKTHPTDHFYRYSDTIRFEREKTSVGSMIQEIANRGWEVGLHPTWTAARDLDEMKHQKESLDAVVDADIKSVRQHYLNYDIRMTPKIHEKAGFKFDSTLGFNDNVGFRFGTSYPWFVWNLNKDTPTDVLEIPLTIQDGALLPPYRGLRLDVDRAFQYVRMLCDRVRDVGGVLTLSWHPSNVTDDRFWQLYDRTLQYVSDRNAWMTGVGEIGHWWNQHNSDLASISSRVDQS
jgi:peptidoglycan/xylan/chitin deacetylase (PgdA/CDA1 family)